LLQWVIADVAGFTKRFSGIHHDFFWCLTTVENQQVDGKQLSRICQLVFFPHNYIYIYYLLPHYQHLSTIVGMGHGRLIGGIIADIGGLSSTT
jgi:hypothetical protein